MVTTNHIKPTIPAGYVQVYEGKFQRGDRCWYDHRKCWIDAFTGCSKDEELAITIDAYLDGASTFMVIRPDDTTLGTKDHPQAEAQR